MNTEENQGTMTEEDFRLPTHPLLSFEDDEFLCSVVERLTSLDSNSSLYYQEFGEIMMEIVFNGVEVSELQQRSFYESTVCSKSIGNNDLYFVCFDCDLCPHPNVYSLLCYECFDKSNHKGHRLIIRKEQDNGSANCDCGDAQALKPEGFCSDHQSKPTNIQEVYQNFPQELRLKFEIITKKSIYSAVSLFELKQYQGLADELINEMLNFWIECYSEVNIAFLQILWTTLLGQFDSPCDYVWHDCEDLQAANKNPQEPHKCTCSLLGNLLKISNHINKENQEKLKKILVECVKDRDFSEHLAIEYAKYLHYFFTQNYHPNISGDDAANQNSLLSRLYVQLYQDDKIIGKVLDSGYFENFLNLFKRVVDGCQRMNPVGLRIIFQLRGILVYFSIPTSLSAQRLAKDEKIALQYLDVIMTFQMKFFYTEKLTINLFDHQINYEAFNISLQAERNLSDLFENFIKITFDLPLEEQKKAMENFFKYWYPNLQNAKAALRDEQSFNPCLERLFCCVLVNYMKDDISTNKLKNLIQENLNCISDEVAQTTIEGPLRALGMIRYLHLIFNYKSGSIYNVYYYNYNALFEIDVVTTQMMLTLLKPEQGLFEMLVENFFSYSSEIQEFFKDPNEENYEKKKLTVIEDFLYFLVFLMTDEICLLNVQSKYKTDNFGQLSLDPRQKLVVKDLLVNILRGYYWTTGEEISQISEKYLPEELEIDQLLLEVSVKDESTKKIRLKDEYASGIDPYILYKRPSVRQDIIETFAEKNNSIDQVSGGDRLDVPQYLKEIQVRLYQSNLPEFLCKYLKMFNLKTGSPLIRPVLKLILLNLQVAEENEVLKQSIMNNFVNDDFLKILDSIDDNFKDCKGCVEKIKKLIQKLQGIMLVENYPQTQKKKEDENTKKKLTAQERMEKLKQSFAEKQAAFAHKNESILQKSMSFEDTEESKKDEHLVCQHCLEKLHISGKEYGLLIYITFTNNFHDKNGVFVEQDYKNLLKADWWPVISSCNHYFHRKCFEVLYKAPKGFEKHFLSNTYESFCPLCKGLCNNFLSLNGEEKESDEINQEVNQNELDKHPQIYQTFTKKIQKILVDLKAKIQLSPSDHATALEEASFVSIETIFERAYQYFIESFSLLENSQNLQKNFELYLVFFKGFRSYFASPDKKPPEDNLQLSAFFNLNNLFLSTQASSTSNSVNYKTEVFLIELMAKNLERSLIASGDNVSGKSELWALKNFILVKIIQTIAFHQNLKLEDCFQLYQSNEDLRDEIISQLTFPVQKIILSYALIMAAASCSINLNLSELFNLLYNEPNNQEEYLTNLFKAVNIPCSFSELIFEIFQELPSRPQSEINFLNSLFDEKLFTKETLKPQLLKFSPRMIQFPENYLEFNTKYSHQKCNLCKEFSTHLFTSICLICGEIMCASYCHNDVNQAGNLNRHSMKYHMGMGIFVDMHTTFYQSLVNTPLNLQYKEKGLFLNNIGQDIASFLEKDPIDIAKVDFKEFKINQEYVKELREIIYQQALRRNIFTVGSRIGFKVNNGFL